jgi:serine/threonine protein kinase
VSSELPAPVLFPESETTDAILRFGHYEVLTTPEGQPWELGKGAMGITYKAFDTRLKIEVVLKQIRSGLLEDRPTQMLFLREARAAAKVRHPNIAAVIHLGDSEPFFYTMEFVAGQPLSSLLEQRGRVSVAEALNYTDQIAAALGAMARERIAHRDLKPANLMLVADDDMPFGHLVKVIDFGLAKGFRDSSGEANTYLSESVTQSGVFSGTPFYASPEQCATQPDIDSRSDLYSVGVILWQMLTGSLPFTGPLGQVLAMHQFQAPPWSQVSRLPANVMEILRRLLEKKPTDRYQSPRELREAIAASGTGDDRAMLPVPGGKWGAPTAPTVDACEAGIATDLPLGLHYHLVESFQEGDAGRLYRALDHEAGGVQVAIKILSPRCAVDEDFLDYVRDEIAKVHGAAQPMLLTSPLEFEESEAGKFIVREWAEGWSLLELLRSRRALNAVDVRQLLAALPEALDAVAAAHLELTEPLLHKLFVTSNAGQWRRADLPALRDLPLAQWPAFRLRWNPLNFRPPYTGTGSEVTRLAEEAEMYTDDPIVALARLIHELLGGRPGGTTALSSCSDHVNSVLRRALSPGGGLLAFASANDFWRALFDDNRPVPPTTSMVRTSDVSQMRNGARAAAPRQNVLSRDERVETPAPPGAHRLFVSICLALIIVAVGVFITRGGLNGNRTVQAAMASLRPVAETPAPPVASPPVASPPVASPSVAPPVPNNASPEVVIPTVPPQTIRAFDNQLGMRLVPVPGTRVLFATKQTRRSDFAVFLKETGYKARNGVAEVDWQRAVLDQPDSQPVANVTFGEARAFCAWLTQRERAARRLNPDQSYRLPTNFEWTMAAGEPGARRASPNRAGLFDLHGAISDWCEAPRGGGLHLVRGGAQPLLIPEDSVNYRSAAVGFRIVLEEGGRRM